MTRGKWLTRGYVSELVHIEPDWSRSMSFKVDQCGSRTPSLVYIGGSSLFACFVFQEKPGRALSKKR